MVHSAIAYNRGLHSRTNATNAARIVRRFNGDNLYRSGPVARLFAVFGTFSLFTCIENVNSA